MTENKQKPKNIKAILLKIVCLFLVANLVLFGTAIYKYTVGKPYPKAAAFLGSSQVMTWVYLIPLEKVFGPDNPLLSPISWSRNKLYDTGMSYLPPDAGERQIWWFLVKAAEFSSIDDVEWRKLLKIDKTKKINKSVAAKYMSWTDEVYKQLSLLEKNRSFKNEEHKSLNFETFVEFSDYYISVRPMIKLKWDGYTVTKIVSNSFTNSTSEVKKFQNILDWLDDLERYTREINPRYIENFKSTPYWEEKPKIQLQVTTHILTYKLLNHQFQCADPLVQKYLESRSSIVKIISGSNITEREKIYFQSFLDNLLSQFVKINLESTCHIH